MQLIKKVELAIKDDASDRVYWIELYELKIESDNRFLLHVRYGQRNETLTEEIKTDEAIDLAQIELLFDRILDDKKNEGFIEENNEEQNSVINTIASTSFRQTASTPFDLSLYLAQIENEKQSHIRSRLIWRLPQSYDASLANWLIKGLESSDFFEKYTRIWVIGRIGDRSHSSAIVPFLASKDQKLAELAKHVVIKLDSSNSVLPLLSQVLPEALVQAIEANNANLIAKWLDANATSENKATNRILSDLYLFAQPMDLIHQILLQFLKKAPLVPGLFQGIRSIFKMAEFRLDSQMFALLNWKLETTKSFYASSNYNDCTTPTGNIRDTKKEYQKANCQIAYSSDTRNYFRRRSWRAIKLLGIQQDIRFVDMAVQILLQFSNADAHKKRTAEVYGWTQDRGRFQRYLKHTNHYDEFSAYLAFNAILYSNGSNYKRNSTGLIWLKNDQSSSLVDARQEAFPNLWDQRPECLLSLLIDNNIQQVSEFAVLALSDNPTFCQSIDDNKLVQILASPYDSVIEFGLTVLTGREISHELIVALMACNHPQARKLALKRLETLRDLFILPQLVVELLLIEDQMLQLWLSGQWQQSFITQLGRSAIWNALLQRLSQSKHMLSVEHAEWLAKLLANQMADVIRILPLEHIEQLITNEDIGIRLFAVHLLAFHQIAYRDISAELLNRIYQSEAVELRAAGLILLRKLNSVELLEQLPLIVDLIYHGEEPERVVCFNLITKLILSYRDVIFDQLLPLLFREELQPGQQQQLLDFIDEHLYEACQQLDKDTLWRLIHARSLSAQKLGSQILTTRQPTEFTVKQWVILTKNPNQKIREYIQSAFDNHSNLAKRFSSEAIKWLETPWEESRENAFSWFKHHFNESDWSPELVISICDSNNRIVQNYGREILEMFFKQEQGEEYLLKLSQHPSLQVQNFVVQFLKDYAADKPEMILSLTHYFTRVLSQINKGRTSKDYIFAFLVKEANSSPQVLHMIAELFSRLSLTLVHKDKAQLIKAMLVLRQQHPDLALPIKRRDKLVVSAGQEVNHAG